MDIYFVLGSIVHREFVLLLYICICSAQSRMSARKSSIEIKSLLLLLFLYISRPSQVRV